ncbi:4733_t:CDS:10 [Ambispora gerdemannii]|uniref:4733_t:CDS:1 n=1 Tax=Ambispora gerdemannii TaxID=144530 RepID=A0A9N8UZL0_9GLOM|nr:4733_t:CDS:10 [Ambispora gerdemannii]
MEKPPSQSSRRNMSASSVTTMANNNTDEHVFSSNFEDYDIRNPIGYGSSAIVYNAVYIPLNKKVAVKIIDMDYFERDQIDELRRETQTMSLSKHANILRVYGSFVKESKLYIVTPYMAAGSCLDIMKTAYPDGLEETVIAAILKQALQGLDYLHKHKHIHRDVKAGNLLMDDDGSVLLADFGVSSSLENGDRKNYRRTFVGTPCWMAPEVMEQAGYDYKADIWSFGITAIELATGHAPFAKYPPLKVLMLTIQSDPPTLNREKTKHKYSKSLKEMIDTCLQKDPTKRPNTERLLNHAFFKQARKKDFLVAKLLQSLPPLEQRPHKRVQQKTITYTRGVSWDFADAENKDENMNKLMDAEKQEDDAPIPLEDNSLSAAKKVSFITASEVTEKKNFDGVSSIKPSRFNSETSTSSSVPTAQIHHHNHRLSQSYPTSTGANMTAIQNQSTSSLPQKKEEGVIVNNSNSNSSLTSENQQQPNKLQTQGEIKKGRFSVMENTKSRERSPSGGSQYDSDNIQHPILNKEKSSENITDSKRGRFEVQHPNSVNPIDIQSANIPAPNVSRENSLHSYSSLSRESTISRSDGPTFHDAHQNQEITRRQQTESYVKQLNRAHTENEVNHETTEKPHTKKGRFEVSVSDAATKVDDPMPSPGKILNSDITYSPQSTYLGNSSNTSPMSTLIRGQSLNLDPNSLLFHIETMMHKLLHMNENIAESKSIAADTTIYLGSLGRQFKSLNHEIEELRKENERLKSKLDQLSKSSNNNSSAPVNNTNVVDSSSISQHQQLFEPPNSKIP